MPKITAARVEELLGRVTGDQAYEIGQVVDGPLHEYYQLMTRLGYTHEEAKEIKQHMSYKG